MADERLPPGAVKVGTSAPIPPGAVRVSDIPPGAEKSESGPDTRSWFQKYVSAPATGAVAKTLAGTGEMLLAPADLAASVLKAVGAVPSTVPFGFDVRGGGLPAAEKAAMGPAKVIVPQSGIEAGILGGTLAAGPLVSTAGKFLPAVVQSSRALSPAGRIAGAALGGAAGGAVTGEGAGTGAALGALTSVLGEGVTAGLGKAARSFVGAQPRIAARDARRLGEAVGELSHPLRGATTADDLNRLASGEGQKRLSAAKEAVIHTIDAFTSPIHVPSLSPKPMTLRAANEQLTELGKRAFTRGAPFELKQQYHTMTDEIVKGLDQVDPTGASAGLWRDAQGEYAKGLAILDRLLSRSGAFTRGTRGMTLNLPDLQRAISDPKIRRRLGQKLSAAEMQQLVDALTRGGGIGTQDVIRSLSPVSLRGMLATGVLGAPGFLVGPAGAAGAAVPFVFPNVLSTYAGRAPYTVSPGGKLAADVLAAKMLSLLEQAAQFQQSQQPYNR